MSKFNLHPDDWVSIGFIAGILMAAAGFALAYLNWSAA